MPSPILPPIGFDITQWGIQLTSFLQTNLAKLGFKTADDNPSEDGVILWDAGNKYVVVSLDDAFRQVATKQAWSAGMQITFMFAPDLTMDRRRFGNGWRLAHGEAR
jgi:hypothetical protein